MRMTAAMAAVALGVLTMFAHTAKADALSPVDLALSDSPSLLSDITKNSQPQEEAEESTESEQSEENNDKPEKVTHTVESGESLIKIGKQYEIDWKRLYFKNKNISHPDQLDIGQKLVIPAEDEELEKREIPRPVVPEPRPATSSQSRATSTSTASAASSQPVSTPRRAPRGSSSGNLYTYGYCTWYVKNRRPDLPNNLGNAITWANRAAAQGIPTGSTPRVGAVGQSGNHVVYVESVNGDGTVTVSEMNWKGWNIKSSRTAPASSFRYIY